MIYKLLVIHLGYNQKDDAFNNNKNKNENVSFGTYIEYIPMNHHLKWALAVKIPPRMRPLVEDSIIWLIITNAENQMQK